ncbi:MAG: CIC family chloride channel protein [Dinoroseobacter sp.]|jgi:CIC family chloride channel protein
MSGSFGGLGLLAILGLMCGFVSGGVIILFRLFMDGAAAEFLPQNSIDRFEDLAPMSRFLLCLGGGLTVGLFLHLLKPTTRIVGVVHVLERLDYHQGYLPIRNAVVQFISASIALLTGQSVGREGPSIHLGATAGSILGRALRIPNNSVRVMVGCGVAAAIAAAFNTPLAGVIFAMEVVIMDYSVIGFAPVIIAAVSATSLTRIVFGDEASVVIPEFSIDAVREIPMMVILGAVIGCISAAFIHITLLTSSLFAKQKIWLRASIAGFLTGFIALFLPQVMGAGYDTVNDLLWAQIGLSGVLLLTVAKLLTSATAIGLGIPAGLIGPTLFIGAAAGAAIGSIASIFAPVTVGTGFYAMLGMAAMMAATLQAPLAALIYLLELTANHAIILPGMAAVISALLVTRVMFNKSSIYQHLMLSRGLDYRNTPASKTLRRIGVASVMDRSIVQQTRYLSREQASSLLQVQASPWLLLEANNEQKRSLLPVSDLALHLSQLDVQEHAKADVSINAMDAKTIEGKAAEISNIKDQLIDLMAIPAKRLEAKPIGIIATLQEAYEQMQLENCEVLVVTGAHGATKERVYGVITKEHIERSYQP